MTIIAISGKAGSGKDAVGNIITNLIAKSISRNSLFYDTHNIHRFPSNPSKCKDWTIKKFAYKVKVITSLLTGIPIDDLEKEEVKNSYLPNCWDTYGYANTFTRDANNNPIMMVVPCSKSTYEEERITNWQTAYKHEMTVRQFMFTLATNAVRDQVHQDTWINALFVDYKPTHLPGLENHTWDPDPLPNWIITDWRFENETKAIETRNGIKIRVERSLENRYPKEFEEYDEMIVSSSSNDSFIEYIQLNEPKLHAHLTHQSETELDKYVGTDYFKYCIYNNLDLEDLIKQCEDILIKEKLI